MKKPLLTICCILIYLTVNSQTQLLGMTCDGGQYGGGIIFKTDNSGNNQTVLQSFFKYDGAVPFYTQLVQANDGKLYGMTSSGGANSKGVLFQYDPTTNTYSKKIDFAGASNGSIPHGSLLQASDGNLYGMTYRGGANDMGVLFQYDPASNTCTKKLDFAGISNGGYPYGALMEASDGKLYGMTSKGGANNMGVLFQYNPTNNTYTKKLDFAGASNGSYPYGSLIQASDGNLYGMTSLGGANNWGVLFQYSPTTNTYNIKLDFAGVSNGGSPRSSLMQASDGKLYGMTYQGGTNDLGVLFQYDPTANTYTKKLDFTGTSNGSYPWGSLMQASDGNLYGMTYGGGANNLGVLFQYDPASNTYIKKLDFDGASNGSNPWGSIIQATDGKLYGMTNTGGANGSGILFQYDIASNTYTKMLDFNWGLNGNNPTGSLMQASDGKLYGMTQQGGINDVGVLFQYDPYTNTYTKKLDFGGASNGSNPRGSLVQASDAKLYGMTYQGGVNNLGVLFQYDPATNTYTKKLDFGGASNGSNPWGSIIQASDGKLYGMASMDGANNLGVLFQYDPITNTYTKKLDFAGASNGSNPRGSLMQANDGKLYGMTYQGGANNLGVLFQYDPTTNTYTKKLDFAGVSNGSNPYGSLMQASDGTLYGITYQGGVNNLGVLFQYSPATNTYTKKLDFSGATNGSNPAGSLMQVSNGKLYGMTYQGGANDFGVLFQYDPATNTYAKKIDFTGANGRKPCFTNLIELAISTSLNDLSHTDNFLIYPNPTSGNFTIETEKESRCIITDILGENIVTRHLQKGKNEINFLNQTIGIYFIKIGNSTFKIVKE